MRLGAPEILIIIAVFVLLFGAKKIPDLAKGLGDGIRQFKNSVREPEEETKEEKKG